MTIRLVQTFILAMGLVACGRGSPPSDPPVISPQDFVLMPCRSADAARPCALIVAGGKRVLFGVPSGAAVSLGSEDLRQLDAVIVFSLRAPDLEGLDEIRNASWRAGRDVPLLTIGPRGILDVVDGLNKAYEQADALRVVEEGIPRGGYDAAILTGREASDVQVVFDTGDVQITRLGNGYRIEYDRKALIDLWSCDGGRSGAAVPDEDMLALSVSCDGAAPDLAWPLRQTHFVLRHQISE